nr:telomere repeat-binding protein 2-like isoform X3 [Populus alba]
MAFDMFPDLKTKPLFRNERTIYSCQRSQKIFPFKKRKFFDQSTLPTFDGAFHCEDIFNSSNKRTNGNNMVSATESSSSVTSQHASLDSRDYNVKLSIKSFKVPELFIEIPTTTTVGSLKRIVMEAITAILGDGLHVGIFSKERRHAKMMLPPHTAETNFNSSVGSDLGAVCSLAKASTADKMSDSRALVPVPAIGRCELSVVPFNCKSTHPEFG